MPSVHHRLPAAKVSSRARHSYTAHVEALVESATPAGAELYHTPFPSLCVCRLLWDRRHDLTSSCQGGVSSHGDGESEALVGTIIAAAFLILI